MKHIFKYKWVVSSLLTALVMMLALSQASVSVSHAAEGDITSQEVQLDGTYFSQHGTLDGLTVTADGLALAEGKSSGIYVSDTLDTPLSKVSDIVPLWKATGTAVTIETRVSLDGGTWSDWAKSSAAFYPVRDDETAGDLIWIGGQKVALQVRVTLQDNATLQHLTLAFSDTSNGPTDSQIAAQMVEANAAAVAPLAKPAVVSRIEWGNPEGPYSPRRRPVYAPVTHIVIHQTETPNYLGYNQNWASIVRSVWNFHANILRWGDVGYNYMVDPNGVIYEGRAGGDEVVGMHDGHNVGSMGIGLIGCYGDCDNPYLGVAVPSEPMLESTTKLMAWKLGQKCIEPHSVLPYDRMWNVPVIVGGRDVSATTSPGHNIYVRLPELRNRVAGYTDSVCLPTTPTVTPITVTVTPTTVMPTATATPTTVTPTPTATATTAPTVVPTATPTTVVGACRVTEVIFNKNQYTVGDTINLTLKLADSSNNPIGGAKVTVDVLKEASTQATSPIDFIDRTGEYYGSYSNTTSSGTYRFTFRATDLSGGRFTPCTTERVVTVIAPVATPTIMPTVIITSTPTTLPTITPTVIITTTPTTTPTTVPTPTPLVPAINNSLSFSPTNACVLPTAGTQITTLSIAKVQNLTAVDLEIAFNQNVVKVIEVIEGSAFLNDKGFVVEKNPNNSTGRIHFAATLLSGNKLSGTGPFDLITIKWQPVANGASQIRINNMTLVDDTNKGIDEVLVNSGYIQIGTNCTTTAGFVTLQGRRNYRAIVVTNEAGDQVETDSNGQFIIAGESEVTVSYNGYLVAKATAGTGVRSTDVSGSSQVKVGNITLLAGDTNHDNLINIFDLSYLAGRMNTADTTADLNKDGKVNIFDLTLAAINYGKQGPLTEWK